MDLLVESIGDLTLTQSVPCAHQTSEPEIVPPKRLKDMSQRADLVLKRFRVEPRYFQDFASRMEVITTFHCQYNTDGVQWAAGLCSVVGEVSLFQTIDHVEATDCTPCSSIHLRQLLKSDTDVLGDAKDIARINLAIKYLNEATPDYKKPIEIINL
jgi:hypothetical protein